MHGVFLKRKYNDEGNEIMIDHGIAFNCIDVDKKYRLAVSMRRDFVEIICNE